MKNSLLVKSLFLTTTAVLVMSACKKDDDYKVPTSYNFENVSYSGQTSRLSMLTELATYAKTANVLNATALDATKMKDMFANSNNPFTETALNSSGKQLKDKTVSTEQSLFEAMIDSLAAASAFTNNTSPANGTAGIVENNDGTKTYLLNANGVELAQVLEKGLMGACFYYQATAVYLGTGKMNVDNVTVTPGEGTAMEHSWDEAFGYLAVPVDFPLNTTGTKFWGKYCNDRESKLGLNAPLMNGFLAGRAAISNDNLTERDAQILIVRRKWEMIAAGTAVSYLNKAIATFSSDAAEKHHAMSEGFAFVYALKWGGDATITATSVDAILVSIGGNSNPLQANLYNTTLPQLQAAKDALVAAFPGLASVKDTL